MEKPLFAKALARRQTNSVVPKRIRMSREEKRRERKKGSGRAEKNREEKRKEAGQK